MYFTTREKSAIQFVVNLMVMADGKLASEELLLSAAVSTKINMDDEAIDASTTLSVDESMSIISAMTSNEKRFVCSYLGTLIAIDGNVDKKEQLLWTLISARCSFPTMSLLDAKNILSTYL